MLKKLIIFLLMALVTSVNAESNETVEEESKISTIGGILQIKKDEVGLKSFFLNLDFSHYFRWLFANFRERFLSS